MSESETITVLVVEDEEVLLQAIGKKMELEGITPVLAPSGQTALHKLSSGLLPDVVWLDYHLNDMDGIAFMAKLEENPAWKEIPVIVVSNSASQENVNAMLLKGAKKYLVKAENKLGEIIEIVKQYVKQQ